MHRSCPAFWDQYPICGLMKLPVSWEAIAFLTCRLQCLLPQGAYRVTCQKIPARRHRNARGLVSGRMLLGVWLGDWACSRFNSCHTALSRTFVWP